MTGIRFEAEALFDIPARAGLIVVDRADSAHVSEGAVLVGA